MDYEKAAVRMYRNDVAILCIAEVVLIALISVMFFVVLGLAQDTIVQVLVVASGVILVVASVLLVVACIKHLKKNHLEINIKDIKQKECLKESKTDLLRSCDIDEE